MIRKILNYFHLLRIKRRNKKYATFFFILKITFLIHFSLGAKAQDSQNLFFNKISLVVDTNLYHFQEHSRVISGKKTLVFEYFTDNQQVEFNFFPSLPFPNDFEFNILPSTVYEVLEDPIFIKNSFYRVKLKFKQLSESELLKISYQVKQNNEVVNFEIPLFPTHRTIATLNLVNDDIYLGEEKKLEIMVNTPENVLMDIEWNKTPEYDYKIFTEQGKIYALVIPLKEGIINFSPMIETRKPVYQNQTNVFKNILFLSSVSINIKKSRLPFLRPDIRDVILSNNFDNGIEIQMDNHRNLILNKTYRIENQEKTGGVLFAEFHALQRLSNNRVLGIFRPYRQHNANDGYLYIKDGDNPIFLTNINILKETNVKKISLMRDGINWIESLNVFPGETVDIKIEGESIHLGAFIFEEIDQFYHDSVLITENYAFYRLTIPINIRKKNLQIFNQGKGIDFSLKVTEFQRPSSLDFIDIHVGSVVYEMRDISEPIFHNKSLSNVLIKFNPEKIDELTHLYGVQFLELEVRFLDEKNQLLELRIIDNIKICPGETSIRHQFYQIERCSNEWININDLFSLKTYSLNTWSKIEITIKHKNTAYQTDGKSKKVLIVLERRTTFDIDLSLPAGLLIKKFGDQSAPSFTGVSLAMLAQLSFYKSQELQKQLPFNAGIGFLAQNALNYNPNAVDNRNFAVIAIFSLKSVKKDRKINFPLYSGFGVYINSGKLFYLFGPGVMVTF